MGERRGERRPIAVVNDEVITQTDLDRALTVYRLRALEELVDQKLVSQWARREHVTVSASELSPSKSFSNNPVENAFLLLRNQHDVLWRKLVIKKVGEPMRKKIYREFLQELRQYDLSVIILSSSKEDARAYQEDFAQNTSFEALALRYSVDETTSRIGGKLGFLSLPGVRIRYGPYAADKVIDLQVGEVTGPVDTPFGTAIFKLSAIKESFDDLAPSIDQILVEGKRSEYAYELYKSAHISSDLIPPLKNAPSGPKPHGSDALPHPSGTPGGIDVSLPAPKLSGTPVVNELPALKSATPGPRPAPTNSL